MALPKKQSQKKDRGFYSKYYREIDVLHGLQSTPSDRDWLLSVPKGEVKPAQVVLYMGCNVMRTTHLMRTVTDVFKLLDVDFVSVGGAAYCCGIQHYQQGDMEASKSVAQTTVKNFEKFQPERVVMWCPSCIFFYDEIMEMRQEFEFQHVTEFLVEHLNKLDLKPQPPQKVALHYHTGGEQTDQEAQATWQLLSALPGIELVDIGTDTRWQRRCTPALRESLGEEGWQALVNESVQQAADVGADVYATIYHGCQRSLCGLEADFPLKVEHYLTVFGRALGIEHEDQYKKHLLSGNADAIMEEVSPCAVASGISLQEARATGEKTFVKPSSNHRPNSYSRTQGRSPSSPLCQYNLVAVGVNEYCESTPGHFGRRLLEDHSLLTELSVSRFGILTS